MANAVLLYIFFFCNMVQELMEEELEESSHDGTSGGVVVAKSGGVSDFSRGSPCEV